MRSITVRERLRAVAAALALPLAGAGPAVAAEKTFEQEILDILRRDGTITEEQYEDLEAKAKAERATQEKPAAAAQKTPAVSAGEEDPKGYKVKWKNSLQIKRNDGNVKLKLGGRIQGDFASIWPGDSLATIDGSGTYAGKEAVEFRRARLYFSGELYKRLVFKAQYDFAGGDADFNDVYIGLKDLGYAGTVLLGHQKEPFSLEELTSSKYITFMERSLPSVFDSSRNFGLTSYNHVLDERMTYALGIYAPTDGFGEWESNDTEFNLTGRVTGVPWWQEDGRKFLHLGLSASYQFRKQSSRSISQSPESHLAEDYLDTGTFESDGNTLLAAELALVHGPFSLQSEWKQGWQQVVGGSTSSPRGAYVYASYFITGENRVYNPKRGVFARVTPTNSFDPKDGKWGAWEVAVRYSWLDLNDKSLNGGEEQNVTAGLNWYLWSNLRMMLNYVYADLKDTGSVLGNRSGDIHIVQTRAAIEF
ncbi:MAG: porin [Deltaproteobacteria bacterium]|nr:porin [Deltaproteobacteria bacterium]